MRFSARWVRDGFLGCVLVTLAGCASAPTRPEPSGDRQCGEFCARIDSCLGDEFDSEMKDRLCRLTRCESGCRENAVAPAGYTGPFQYAKKTWTSLCYPIFSRRGLDRCRTPQAMKDLCCASTCTAEIIAQGGIGHWPHCGKK